VLIPAIQEPPDMLKDLLSEQSVRSKHFKDNIRAYNASLAFTSIGTTGTEFKFATPGPYCYRISGQIYHRIGHFEPEQGHPPKFSQIYFYDQANEAQNRISHFPDGHLDEELLSDLQNMLKDCNPFVNQYKNAVQLAQTFPTADVQLILHEAPSGNTYKSKMDSTDVNIRIHQTSDPRTYNLPTGTDISAILPISNNDGVGKRDVVIYKNSSYHPDGQMTIKMDERHQMYDPMMYVLMFPFGDFGWNLNTPTTVLRYYRARLMTYNDKFNTLHRCGRLFQQFIVDMYSKIEGQRLLWIRLQQSTLRCELYQGIADAMADDSVNAGSPIGKKVILPSSFTGSPRYQYQLYQDAMRIVTRYGKPDYFITFTCNPR